MDARFPRCLKTTFYSAIKSRFIHSHFQLQSTVGCYLSDLKAMNDSCWNSKFPDEISDSPSTTTGSISLLFWMLADSPSLLPARGSSSVSIAIRRLLFGGSFSRWLHPDQYYKNSKNLKESIIIIVLQITSFNSNSIRLARITERTYNWFK